MSAGSTRGRDLRRNIAELGFERGVVTTLELHLDEFISLRQSMTELAKIQNDIIDSLVQLGHVIQRTQHGLDELQKNEINRIDQEFKDIRDKS